MTNFGRLRLTTTTSRCALSFALVTFGATPLFAQTQAAPAAAPTAATQGTAPTSDATVEDKDSIVITGFRRSLQKAIDTKKRSEQVVESVSSEDIGKLPDNGIGESIARLPGLAAQRSQGRANIISIRGFGPDFSTTTLNGREQTTTNDSRAVEFDQFPSEILSQVVVYKTPAANLTAGGIVGSIDLRTIRPLDAGKRIIAVGARGTYSDYKLQKDSRNTGFRVYGTYVDQFAEGKVGIALSASYTDEPYQTKDWNAWGFNNYGSNAGVIGGTKSWFESSDLKRFGLNGTVQAELSDNITMTWDAFYSHFDEKINQRGFETPLFNISNVTVQAPLVVGATYTGVYGVVENYANDRKANLFSAGWNTTWNGHNGWRGVADLSYSSTKRSDRFLQTTAGTGHATSGPADTLTLRWTDTGPIFTHLIDYTNPATIVLTDVQGWSGSTNQAGYDNLRNTRDSIFQARGELEREIGGFFDSVKVGANYTDRSKTLTSVEAFLVPPNGAAFAVIPNSLLGPTVDLDRGLGPILSYDPREIVNQGILSRVANSYGDGKGYKVTEKLFTPYIMAVIKHQFDGAELTGNIGIQAVHVTQGSEGLTYPNGTATKVSVKSNYWEVLPTMNLAFRFPSDVVVRVAAGQAIMRPRMPQLTTNIGYGYNNVTRRIEGSGGNPYLKPYKTTGIDLTLEKYFGGKGYVAVQAFYKHMDRYIANGNTPFDYASFPPLIGVTPPSTVGILNTDVNTKGGYIYGIELAGTIPFSIISPSLSAFGLTGGLGYTKTRVKDFNGNLATIPGYSKWVGSLTAFYEQNGINVRGSMRYRSAFQGDFALYSGGLDRQTVLAETIFDAQVGYDFAATSALHGLSVYLQGQNLTNERSATIEPRVGADNAFLKYQTYGRRFLAGFTYKFR